MIAELEKTHNFTVHTQKCKVISQTRTLVLANLCTIVAQGCIVIGDSNKINNTNIYVAGRNNIFQNQAKCIVIERPAGIEHTDSEAGLAYYLSKILERIEKTPLVEIVKPRKFVPKDPGARGVKLLDPKNDRNKPAECIICYTNFVQVMVAPCFHFCLCNTCALLIATQKQPCPLCRGEISWFYPTFIESAPE